MSITTLKRFMPNFINNIIDKKHNKIIKKAINTRIKVLKDNIKIDKDVNSNDAEAIIQNAETIGRYAQRKGVNLEFIPNNDELIKKTEMKVYKTESEIIDDEQSGAAYQEINKYDLGTFPLQDSAKSIKEKINNIKYGIKQLAENALRSPETKKLKDNLSSILIPF